MADLAHLSSGNNSMRLNVISVAVLENIIQLQLFIKGQPFVLYKEMGNHFKALSSHNFYEKQTPKLQAHLHHTLKHGANF